MPKNARNGGPDLLALAMRRARADVAAGRVPGSMPDGARVVGDTADMSVELDRPGSKPAAKQAGVKRPHQ